MELVGPSQHTAERSKAPPKPRAEARRLMIECICASDETDLVDAHAGRIEFQPDEWCRAKVLHTTGDGDIALRGRLLRQPRKWRNKARASDREARPTMPMGAPCWGAHQIKNRCFTERSKATKALIRLRPSTFGPAPRQHWVIPMRSKFFSRRMASESLYDHGADDGGDPTLAIEHRCS